MKCLLWISSIFALTFCCLLQFYFQKIENASRNSSEKEIEVLREKLSEEFGRRQKVANETRSALGAQNDEKIRAFRANEEKKLEEFKKGMSKKKARNDEKREMIKRRRLIGLGRANEVLRDLGLIQYNVQGVTRIGVCSVESAQPVENGELLIKYHNVSSERCKPVFKILFYDACLKWCGEVEKKSWMEKKLVGNTRGNGGDSFLSDAWILKKVKGITRYGGLNPGESYEEKFALKIKEGFVPQYLRIEGEGAICDKQR